MDDAVRRYPAQPSDPKCRGRNDWRHALWGDLFSCFPDRQLHHRCFTHADWGVLVQPNEQPRVSRAPASSWWQAAAVVRRLSRKASRTRSPQSGTSSRETSCERSQKRSRTSSSHGRDQRKESSPTNDRRRKISKRTADASASWFWTRAAKLCTHRSLPGIAASGGTRGRSSTTSSRKQTGTKQKGQWRRGDPWWWWWSIGIWDFGRSWKSWLWIAFSAITRFDPFNGSKQRVQKDRTKYRCVRNHLPKLRCWRKSRQSQLRTSSNQIRSSTSSRGQSQQNRRVDRWYRLSLGRQRRADGSADPREIIDWDRSSKQCSQHGFIPRSDRSPTGSSR